MDVGLAGSMVVALAKKVKSSVEWNRSVVVGVVVVGAGPMVMAMVRVEDPMGIVSLPSPRIVLWVEEVGAESAGYQQVAVAAETLCRLRKIYVHQV